MATAIDPFHPLTRLVDRYRHGVHQLQPPGSEDAIAAGAALVGGTLPPTLEAFLQRWNGAILFRGALRVRSAAELAPAAADAPDVIVFADGPAQADRWAFLPCVRAPTGVLFGKWSADTATFEPLHERFDRWLAGTVRILDGGLRGSDAHLDARLDVDPDNAYLLLADARRLLSSGQTHAARARLERATTADPELLEAWSLLGDVVGNDDPAAARFAWLRALRSTRLPARRPDAPPPQGLIDALSARFPPGDLGWERELSRFIDEAVADAGSAEEAALIQAAVVARARCQLQRHERATAAAGLSASVDRLAAFTVPPSLVEPSLLLARVLVDLGRHDEAERRLRPLRQCDPVARAKGLLVAARIAVARQEPWADVMLADVLAQLTPDRRSRGGVAHARARAEAWLLTAERHRTQGDNDAATAALVQSRRLAAVAADPHILAEISLMEGDLARQAGDGSAAEEAWREAHSLADGDPELLNRVLLRRGDLYRMTGDTAGAATDYRRAAEGFAELGLTVREAWAHLRLGALGAAPALERARARFRETDLAIGVTAVDTTLGDPTHSLSWHLERAAEHARDRTNAQRNRPPLTRADAERPERRLGAHRLAVSSSDVRVVHTLASFLSATAAGLERSRGATSDPSFARYVAAVDLIAAHRSYDAAEILLRQLLDVRPSGAAGRALVAAMARSPNAALVDGLLEALDGGFDPAAMAAAIEVLGWRREKTAGPVLRELAHARQPRSVRRAAVVALGRIGDHEAVDVLLPILDEGSLTEETSTALLLLGEWRGVDARAQALARHPTDTGRSLGEIVGRYGGPNYLLLLYRAAEAEGPAGLGAIQGLGYLGDPRAVERLIDVLAGRDPIRAQVASGALELITGHHEDPEESLLRNRWMLWWDHHRDRFRQGTRYRHGEPFSPGLLIERLTHSDGSVRRTSYDELVISTGAHLPFDADGPYRVQCAHVAAWRRWWDDHGGAYGQGGWYFHGERIG